MSRRAVILAGGKGSRLGPYTTVLPKPLLPIGERAILDMVIERLRSAGFDEIVLAVDHLARLIKVVFGDGSEQGVRIGYSEAARPLGTAGALREIPDLDAPFVAMNGDVLTTLDFAALYQAHIDAGNVVTIASHRRVVEVDYGVLHVEANGSAPTAPIVDYEEKPEIHYTVSMGVYVVSPQAIDYIPRGEPFDMPELVQRLIDAGERVGSYLYEGVWFDIGRSEDYEQALDEYGPPQVEVTLAGGFDPVAPVPPDA
jgi:NDP-sugar pyrophosphorylase family protein